MPKKKKSGKKVKAVRKKTSRPGKKRPLGGKTAPKKEKRSVGSMVKVGEITHYFPHVKAAALLVLKDSIKIGDKLYLKGHTTDFKEAVKSMQLDRVPVSEGKKGQEIGLAVKKRVRTGDSVYKL